LDEIERICVKRAQECKTFLRTLTGGNGGLGMGELENPSLLSVPAMIYFLQDTHTQAIKIGYSKSPAKRHNALQTANPYPIAKLGAIHGGLEDERALHDQFAAQRLNGEWFDGSILPAVLEVIRRYPMDRPAPRNVIVFGEAGFADRAVVMETLEQLHAANPVRWIVTGGDREAERWAAEWARRNRVGTYSYWPQWRKYGRFAPFRMVPKLLGSMFDPKLYLVFQVGSGSESSRKLIRGAEKSKSEVIVKTFTPKPFAIPRMIGRDTAATS
jgi:hypothetical protein